MFTENTGGCRRKRTAHMQERKRVENREVINDVLVHLFNEIMELEEQAIITEEYKDITNNDMHIIEAVGLGGNKMSDIAAKLNIT